MTKTTHPTRPSPSTRRADRLRVVESRPAGRQWCLAALPDRRAQPTSSWSQLPPRRPQLQHRIIGELGREGSRGHDHLLRRLGARHAPGAVPARESGAALLKRHDSLIVLIPMKRTSSALLLLLPVLLLSQPPQSVIADTDGPATVHNRHEDDSSGHDSRRGPRETMSRRHGFPRAGQVLRSRTGPPARTRRISAVDYGLAFGTDRLPPRSRDVPVTEEPWSFAIMRN